MAYTPTGNPQHGGPGSSATIRAEFQLVATAINDISVPTSPFTPNAPFVSNSAGTAMVQTTGTLALAGNLATTGAFDTTLIQTASITLTLPGATGQLITRDSTDTLSNKTLVAPALGTPASGNLSNCTGTAASLNVGHATTADVATAAGVATTATTATTVTTNANLTGPITSSGNATAIASQTGTGSTFVMAASPTLTGTPLAPTAAHGTNTTQIATTAYVLDAISFAGGGTVTSVSVTTAAGVSGSVATATSTPAITITLGDITPTTVAANAFKGTSSSVNAQTGTSYTLVAGDNGITVTMNNASASTLTVPSGLAAGFSCVVVQLGAGQVTISPSSTTLRAKNGLKLSGQYAQAGLFYIASNTYSVGGDLTT